MEAYLKPVPKPCGKKIYEQIENYLYRINEKEGNYEIGYFIRLKDKNKKSHLALVTSPNVLKDIESNSLKITLEHEPKSIELGDIRYVNKTYNKAVIEVKDKDSTNILIISGLFILLLIVSVFVKKRYILKKNAN